MITSAKMTFFEIMIKNKQTNKQTNIQTFEIMITNKQTNKETNILQRRMFSYWNDDYDH